MAYKTYQNGLWRAVNNSMRATVDEMAINAVDMKQVFMVVLVMHWVSTFRHPHADCHGAQSLWELDWPLQGLEKASPFKSYIQYVFLEAPYLLSAASCLFQLRSSRQLLEPFKPTKQSSLLILAVPKCFRLWASSLFLTSHAQLMHIYSHWPGPKSLQTRQSYTSNIHTWSLRQDRLAMFLASLENNNCR